MTKILSEFINHTIFIMTHLFLKEALLLGHHLKGLELWDGVEKSIPGLDLLMDYQTPHFQKRLQAILYISIDTLEVNKKILLAFINHTIFTMTNLFLKEALLLGHHRQEQDRWDIALRLTHGASLWIELQMLLSAEILQPILVYLNNK